jgi:hypothetical protein
MMLMVGAASMARAEGHPAAGARCDDARVQIEGRLPDRWVEPVAGACGMLAAMPDRDPAARVAIRPVNDDLVVSVSLADGRTATRRIHAPPALGPTLEALLALPSIVITPRAVDPADPPDLVRPNGAVGAPFDVELGGGLGGRVAGPGPYVAASISAFVQVVGGHWVLGTGMRWDAFEHLAAAPPGFETAAIALSLTAARRFKPGDARLDVGVSPRFVTQTQTIQPPSGEVSDTDADVRPAAFARAVLGRGTLRFLLDADVEVSPLRLRREIRALAGFPLLPAWGAGLTLGLQWGEP